MFFEALKRVTSIGIRHAGKVYTPEGFVHLLRMQFRDPYLKFYTGYNKQIKRGHWTIKAEYRPDDDENGNPSIHVLFEFPPNERRCYINKHRWGLIGFQVADILTHEYLHQYYCRGRNYRYGRGYRQAGLGNYRESWQDYLGCEDEILAHGFNVASEMIVFERKMEQTKVYRLYAKHFKHDPYVLLKLKKQVVKYIKRLERS